MKEIFEDFKVLKQKLKSTQEKTLTVMHTRKQTDKKKRYSTAMVMMVKEIQTTQYKL